MEDQRRENLSELLRQFFEPDQARAAREDIRAGDRLLDAWAAPGPRPETIGRIKDEITVALVRRHRITLTLRRSLAAAAVIAFALLGLLYRDASRGPDVFRAGLLPAAIWDSEDIAADDLDLARMTAEVRQIEAQLQALEAGEDEASGTMEEFERELMQIETELRKG
ncbi:MAG: hypothetical protein JW955_01890 [Sedimentisphaerales bacterium]|nr:hypothetical protein [Sedimentisphaerales bacterium]